MPATNAHLAGQSAAEAICEREPLKRRGQACVIAELNVLAGQAQQRELRQAVQAAADHHAAIHAEKLQLAQAAEAGRPGCHQQL